MKRIAALTGTRADFGLMSSVFRAMKQRDDTHLSLIATGMHFVQDRGYTFDEVRAAALHNDLFQLPIVPQNDSKLAMANYVAHVTSGMAKHLSQHDYDALLLIGDRAEMLGAAMAAGYLGVPVGQVHAGEVSGHIDNPARHSISRFAHLLFATTEKNGERLIKMGEQPDRVHVVGAPSLDTIVNVPLPKKEELAKRYELSEKYVLFVFHPVHGEEQDALSQLYNALNGVKGMRTIAILPNTDSGGQQIADALKAYDEPGFTAHASLPYHDYLGILRDASVLVGNSSSGIIESPIFKVPTVNIGSRQNGRETGENVLHVPQPFGTAIRSAVDRCLLNRAFKRVVANCTNPYGNGTAGPQIARIMAETEYTPEFMQKQLTY